MIDLHCHSTASDGTLPPAELVRLAAERQLQAVALTDHDTVDGVDEFLTAAREYPQVTCIPGIEFSCHIDSANKCHLVGLFLSHFSETFRNHCRQIVVWRQERNLKIIERLNSLGYAITADDVRNAKGVAHDANDDEANDVLGRPHIAAALVAKGYCSSNDRAFEKLIGRGCPAYIPRQVLDVADSIKDIHESGGLAIWAHPMTVSSMTYAKLERLLRQMQEAGLDGIEAYYPEHTPLQTKNVIAVAKKLGLLVSGGSDFHGANRPKNYLGTGHGSLRVPDELLPPMLAARDQRAAQR